MQQWNDCQIGVCAVLNGWCDTATPAFDGKMAVADYCGGPDFPPLPASCDEGQGVQMLENLWYRHLASCDGVITVSTCGSGVLDTRRAAYSGECNSLTLLACSDNAPGCRNRTSRIDFPVRRGEYYYIRTGIASPMQGDANVTMSHSGGCIAGDINGDGAVNGVDLGQLLLSWSIPPGSPGCAGQVPCFADLNQNGVVNGVDLGQLLSLWTP